MVSLRKNYCHLAIATEYFKFKIQTMVYTEPSLDWQYNKEKLSLLPLLQFLIFMID